MVPQNGIRLLPLDSFAEGVGVCRNVPQNGFSPQVGDNLVNIFFAGKDGVETALFLCDFRHWRGPAEQEQRSRVFLGESRLQPPYEIPGRLRIQPVSDGQIVVLLRLCQCRQFFRRNGSSRELGRVTLTLSEPQKVQHSGHMDAVAHGSTQYPLTTPGSALVAVLIAIGEIRPYTHPQDTS